MHVLLEFMSLVDRNNIFINFDPANMILYGSGQPLAALELLGHYVRSVHCKDAAWSSHPGKEWGQEVPLGHGAVGMKEFLLTLQKIGYEGSLTIERELSQAPSQQRTEISHAINLLEGLKKEILSKSHPEVES